MSRRKINYWTLEKAFDTALHFKSRTEFEKNESGAYYFLIKKNKLDEACEHMNNIIYDEQNYIKPLIPKIDYNNFEEVLAFINSDIICYESEIWAEYPDYNFIECSNFGRIRTKSRIIEVKIKDKIKKRFIEGKIIKQHEHIKGQRYLSAGIRINKKCLGGKSHRIIMTCLKGKSDKFVDHINGIRYDNRIENLRYVTCKENSNNPITKIKCFNNCGYNTNKYFKEYTLHNDEIFVKISKNCLLSNYGVIYNENTKTYTIGHINNYGYRMFSNKKIHRLVAEYFLENPLNLPIVDHIDGNKENNYAKNLRWVTRKENANNPNTKKGMKKVKQYDLNGNYIKTYKSVSSVKEDGFLFGLVSAVCLGKRKTHGGFIWKYA